jgi:hypothetical protein
MVPSNKIAGSGAKYASNAAGTDTNVIVELLANPASTVTNLAETGTDLNQSAKSSEERSQGLTSSLRLMLKSSLGYSDSCESEVFGEGGDDGSEPSEEADCSMLDMALASDEDRCDSCRPGAKFSACVFFELLSDNGTLATGRSPAGLVFERPILLGKS